MATVCGMDDGASDDARRRRALVVWGSAAGLTAVVVAAVLLWAFQPWRLLTSRTVDEALPSVAPVASQVAPAPSSSQPAVAPSVSTQPPAAPAPPAAPPSSPVVLSEGAFVSHEHPTSGVAKIVKLPDGSRFLRLESFATSDGPDVHVWLTDQPASGRDWSSYDDGRHVRLGKLRGTHGNQNYELPPDVDLTGLRSVVIWCDRFNVSFGSAPLSN